jgi:4-alpha-glucanotransferase
MQPHSFEQLLDQAASDHGIGSEYWDIWGHQHRVSVEARQAMLAAMGVEAASQEALEKSLSEAARRDWLRALPPAVVTGEADAIELPVTIPAEWLGRPVHFQLHKEDGETKEFEVRLWEHTRLETREMDGHTRLRLRVSIPERLPLGYHEISFQSGSVRAVTRYIVTPGRAWTDPHLGRGGRVAGITVSLYGVRSERNWGCGDFTDLAGIIDWVAEDLGASFVGLNPLHAIHNRRPFNTSPYLPNCTYFQNFLYLDVEAMDDFARSARAQRLRKSPAVRAEIAALRETTCVEYERVAALKLGFLKLLFVEFLRLRRKDPGKARDFDVFVSREGELLERFATYSALDEYLHRQNPDLWIWTAWPEEYRDPTSPAVAAFRLRHRRSVEFYQYLQWQIDLQQRRAQQRARHKRMSIGIYHDLALATDRFGSDLWAHRPFFVSGCRVGSPPDDFSPTGQDWGFPPPNTERHREDGYRLYAESIRHNLRHAGALRIDHVMRLFRLYWIPDGCDATQGAYVRERSQDFLRILALESVRHRALVVGEDLGTVEPEVRETLARFGILSYRLFYFEKNERGEFRSFDEYPAQALVSSTTHDLPTLAGFWIGADIAARFAAGMIDEAGREAQLAQRATEKQKMLDELFALGLLPPEWARSAALYPELVGEIHNAIVGFLARTPSQLLAINEEDLTKETEQQNLPGTTWQYPNWGRKMRYTIEELRSDPQARGYTAMFRNWIDRTGRRNRERE